MAPSTETTPSLRPELQEIVDDLAASPKAMRLELLLDFGDALPPLPAHLVADRGALERVAECQTPLFVSAEPGPDGRVALHFDAPPEAPTTRGYAGVLSAGLSGATAEEILSTPSDVFVAMGLSEVISPLRLRGMGAVLSRVKRQVHERADGDAS
jgi:cysteine desulfuration protein SufE